MAANQEHASTGPTLNPTAKRRFPRFRKSVPMSYRIIDMKTIPHRGRTVNISGGGVCFRSEGEIGLGKTIALEIDIPKAASLIVAIGRVVWAKRIGERTYENGVRFLWTGQRERDSVKRQSLNQIVDEIENEGINSFFERG
jgi:Tfp pilus assembly protein PilZ